MPSIITNNARDICTKALRTLGVAAANETPSAEDLREAVEWLNIWLKSSQADGHEVYLRTREQITLADGTATYDLPNLGPPITGVIEVIQAVAIESGQTYEQPLELLSRNEYMDLPNKDTEAKPTHLFPEFTDTTQKVTMWPVPDAAYTLKLDVRKKFTEIDALDDTLQSPDHWQMAMVYGVAKHCIGAFGLTGTPDDARITAMADDAYNTSAAFEIMRDGDGAVRFVPDMRFYG
jgi:hypothetical protein